MAFVDEQTVNTEFFKGYYVVLAALVVELFQLCLDSFFGFFKLLD